jgi:hypothetical protein
MNSKTMTYAELKLELSKNQLDDDTLITFGAGDLSLTRVQPTQYGQNKQVIAANFEFNQIYLVTADGDTEE